MTAGLLNNENREHASTKRASRIADLVRTNDHVPVLVSIAAIWAVFAAANDRFLTPGNLTNLTLQIVGVGAISVGVVFVLLLGEIDLSVGALSGFAAGLMAILNVHQGQPAWLAIVVAIVGGGLVGTLQGVVITTFRLPAFVVTLAGLLVWQGALLLLDASQCCGAVPLDVSQLGVDFMVSAGYKWLLGPFGTGFFWARHEHLSKMRPGPFYWMAAEGAENFAALNFADPKPANAARRWDAAETANYYNLAALEAGLELVLRIGPQNIAAHNHKLVDQLFSRLPLDRFVVASPLDHQHRGPYGCFQARTPEKTKEYYDKLRDENIITSLRENKIRVSPYIYNNERDIDRLISVVTI